MSPPKLAVRRRLLAAIAIAILALYAFLSWSTARSAARRMLQARDDLAEVRAKLRDLDRLHQVPGVASLERESPAEIANRVERARVAAGLAESSLLREQPFDPQRVQKSDFEIRLTSIELAPADLGQILQFCDALRDAETGAVVRDLLLTEPRGSVAGAKREVWEAELVLTQMIFSPKSR